MNEIKVYATSKYVRMSPQKVRLVVDMVRGENAQYAAELLQFVNKAAALPVKKTIESAISNATNNFELNKKELKIVEARVDEAPTYKRGRAASKGRYHQILKRNSHITIAVSDGSEVKESKKKAKTEKPEVIEVEPGAVEVTEEVGSKKNTKKNQPKGNKKMLKSDQVKNAGTQRRVQAKGNA